HADRAVDRPVHTRGPAGRPAPDGRRRSLHVFGEASARREPRPPLARPLLPRVTVSAAALRAFTRAVFVAAGLSDAHATTIADVLVWADLRGVDSHGVARIPMYVRLLDAGDLNPAPAI